jgi:NAD(P)-dependent dehydrogenase (short-subunit alcohol dehydrogenase family)
MNHRILITGAAGMIGTFLRPRLVRPGRTLRLLDVRPVVDQQPREDVIVGDIANLAAIAPAFDGVDAVVHLAGLADEAPLHDLLTVNVEGTHNVLEAARAAGARRIILASSSHAVGFHRWTGAPIPADTSARPDTYYGLSKVAMEALASLYVDRFGMDIACLRLGTCRERPPDARALSTWLSPDDVARLVEACLVAPPFGHRLVWGVSANSRRRWSLTEGIQLGYEPHDDAETFAGDITDVPQSGRIAQLIGGPFCFKPLGLSPDGQQAWSLATPATSRPPA